LFTRHRTTAVVAAAAAVSLALAACSSGNSSDGSSASGDGIVTGQYGGQELHRSDPVSGGSLTIGLSFPVPELDPAQAFGGSIEFVLRAIYDQLMKVNPDGSISPELAESLTTDDNTVWTLTLPDDVKFTDGTPFNADAVIAQVNRVAAPDSTSLDAASARGISKMDKLDDFTVQFTLAAPDSQFNLLLATSALAMIPSPTAVESEGADFATKPVGAGPFVVTSFSPNGEIDLEKNADYRIDGKPYLDSVKMIPLTDEASRVSSIQSGDIDAASLETSTSIEDATDAGVTVLNQPTYSQYWIVPNLTNPILSDPRVRRAIDEAVNRDAISQTLFDGLQEPANGILTSSQPYYEEDSGWPTLDLDDAKQQIADYEKETGTSSITLDMMVNQDKTSSDIAALLKQQLSEVGITLNYTAQDPTSQIAQIVSGSFETFLFQGTIPAETSHSLASHFGTGSFLNFGLAGNPDLDALFAQAAAAKSDDERTALIPKELDVIREWEPVIPIVGYALARIVGPRVLGFPDGDPNTTSMEVFDLREVWVQQ